MYFEAVINFWEEDVDENTGEDVNVHVHKHVLCQAINYTDAEALATEYGSDITVEDFDINPIKEMKIEDYHPLPGEPTDVPWFKCGCIYYDINEKGKRKAYKRAILVQSSDSKEAAARAKELMNKWSHKDDCEVPNITKTKITAILTPL
jgi:hypothetical protein